MDAQWLLNELTSQRDSFQRELHEIEGRREFLVGEIREMEIAIQRVKGALRPLDGVRSLPNSTLQKLSFTVPAPPARQEQSESRAKSEQAPPSQQPDLLPADAFSADVAAHLAKLPNGKTGAILDALVADGADFSSVKDPYNKVWHALKRMEQTGKVRYNKRAKTWSLAP